jgi:hypothetical protein
MKLLLSITALFCFSAIFAQQQTPFFEQIAFDYFKKEIVIQEKVENKLYVSDSLQRYSKHSFNWPVCFKNYLSADLISVNASHQSNIKIFESTNPRIFKSAKRNAGNCHVVESLDMKNGNHVVNIFIYWTGKGDIYHIEMDEKGTVLQWCKSGWVE